MNPSKLLERLKTIEKDADEYHGYILQQHAEWLFKLAKAQHLALEKQREALEYYFRVSPEPGDAAYRYFSKRAREASHRIRWDFEGVRGWMKQKLEPLQRNPW